MKQKLNFLAGLMSLLTCTSIQAGIISAKAYVEYGLSSVVANQVVLEVVDGTSLSTSLTEAASILTDNFDVLSSTSDAVDSLNGDVQEAYSEGKISISSGFASADALVVDSGEADADTEIGVVFEVMQGGELNVFADVFLDVTDLLNTQSAASLFLDIRNDIGDIVSKNNIELLDENIGDGFDFNINVLTGYTIEISGVAEAFASHPENVAQISEPATGMLFVLGSTLLIGLMKRRNQ